ncbi:hypothetical protein VTP01DRAFT_8020 [Rhizomucor pusillus]|uniref:uncharacterized protein n=1 Tax=Rhizomucor pusillus TaxID=4840 RepID=UPI00374276D7
MINITREHALCIFYQLKFNEENSIKAKQKFEPLSEEFEICYLDDPTIPVLVMKLRIHNERSRYHIYDSSSNTNSV